MKTDMQIIESLHRKLEAAEAQLAWIEEIRNRQPDHPDDERGTISEIAWVWAGAYLEAKQRVEAAERERDEWRHQARDTENALAEVQAEIARLRAENERLEKLYAPLIKMYWDKGNTPPADTGES